MLITSSAQGQNLFVQDSVSGDIYEYTLGGARTTFASGLSLPDGLAFNSAGDLFEADNGSGNIYEYTPSGVQQTPPFASGFTGLHNLTFLAFQPVPEPSVLGLLAVGVTALIVRRRKLAA